METRLNLDVKIMFGKFTRLSFSSETEIRQMLVRDLYGNESSSYERNDGAYDKHVQTDSSKSRSGFRLRWGLT